MAIQNKLSLLVEATQYFALQTGCIWYLPLNYVMESPPLFLFEVQDDCFIEYDESIWMDTNTGRYEYGSKEQNVVLKAKVRPFLVFQQPELLRTLESLQVPKWYGDSVTGFPISGVENLEDETKAKINLRRLKDENNYDFIHYIPTTGKNGLLKDSCAILCAPINVNIFFFTTHIGQIEQRDTNSIKRKVRRIFDLDN